MLSFRPLPLPRHVLLLLLLGTLLGNPARAADDAAAPAGTPFDPATAGAAADTPAAPSPAPADAPYDPDFDATLPEIPATGPVAVDANELQPPAIDAYVEVSFTDSQVHDFGFGDHPGGYRLIAGFWLESVGNDRWSLAPEVGYLRIGSAEDVEVTRTVNAPVPQFINIRTETDRFEMSTLQFGARAGYHLTAHADAFLRAGIHAYHNTAQSQTVLTYEPNPNPSVPPPDVRPTESSTDVGTDLFGGIGLTYSLGKIPSLFVEYDNYRVGSKVVATTAFGFLLNF